MLLVVIAAVAFASARQSPQRLAQFVEWCNERGVIGLGDTVRVGVAPFGGLGLFAERSLLPGCDVLKVPLRLAMSDRLLLGLDGAAGSPPWPRAPWQATLACRLSAAMHREASSPWAPWLDVLPEGVQGLPRDADVEYPPATAELAAVHTERAATTARILASDVPLIGSAVEVERALTLASTRAFLLSLEVDDPWATCHAFVPVVDLFNHARYEDADVEWSLEGLNAGGGYLRVVARRAVESGEHLSLAYDPTATNDDYAIYHGFTPPSNEFDDVELFGSLAEAITWHRATYACVPSAEAEAAARSMAEMAVLGDVHMRRVGIASAGPEGEPLWCRATEADPRLIVALRLLASELSTPPQDPAVHAASAVVRRCEELLAAFPTTLEDDLAALGGARPTDINAAVAQTAIDLGAVVPAAVADGRSNRGSRVAEREGSCSRGPAEEAAVRYRAGKKLVLLAAIGWLRSRWPAC